MSHRKQLKLLVSLDDQKADGMQKKIPKEFK